MAAFGTMGQCQPKQGKRHLARILEFEEHKNSFDRIISQWQPVKPLKIKKARYKKVQSLKCEFSAIYIADSEVIAIFSTVLTQKDLKYLIPK